MRVMNNLIGIIIVNYNTSIDTLECLSSINNLHYKNFRVYCIDNNSNEENKKILSDNFPNDCRFSLKLNDTNLGFSGGNNIGIKKAIDDKCDFICLLNNDTVVSTSLFEKMLDPFYNKENIAIVCPKIYDYYNRNNVSYGGGELCLYKGGVFIEGINRYDINILNCSRYITFASGCCMLIKTEILKKVGMLSEDFFLYFEDTDYSLKVIKKGYKIYYESKAYIFHKESKSTKRNSAVFQYYFIRNRFLFIKNNFDILHKYFAYLYSILFVIKGVINSNFDFRVAKNAFFDFLKGKKGKQIS